MPHSSLSTVQVPAVFSTIRIDKSSPTPAYIQIAQALSGLITRGRLPAGTPLPPERTLSELTGVSRMTLREATSLLEQKGLIESHRGRGTFVTGNRLRKQQQEMRGFTEEIQARGGVPSSRLISFDTVAPSSAAREFFHLEGGQRVYQICRVRLCDGNPLAVETVHLSQVMCPGLERFDLGRNSLYVILENTYGLRLEGCVEEISAEVPNSSDAKLLALPRNTAVLVVDRKSFADSGQPLELTRSVYRGDLYRAVVRSVRKRNESF